jgi:nucleoside-diphosphate-sugar epimerase
VRILVAGAGGAIGRRLIPLMLRNGHDVGALTRSESKRNSISSLGATVFVGDALNAASVETIVATFRPDTIVNQLTAIPEPLNIGDFEREFALTNRLRTEGTENLIAAAKKAEVARFVAQGFAGSPYARIGGGTKTESDPFDPDPPKQLRTTFAALRHLESSVLSGFPAAGVVLRYGWFYGPGTSISLTGSIAEAVKKRMLPIVAGGSGLWSFLHVDDAASATLAALHGEPGIYNVADDEPALVRDWIAMLAELLRAKAPRHLPAWVARSFIGEHGVVLMRDNRGISNAKAKQALGWKPCYPDWRAGFQHEFSRSSDR